MIGLGLSLAKSEGVVSSDPWWPSQATMAIDFTSNRAMKNNVNINVEDLLSCSRATIGTAKDSSENDITFGINELRITDKGLYIHEAINGTDSDIINFNDHSWFNSSVGTLLFEWEQIIAGSARQTIMRWRDINYGVWAQIRSGNYTIMQLPDTSLSLVFNDGMYSAPSLGVHKVIGAFAPNDMAFARSSSLDNSISTDINGTPIPSFTDIQVGRSATGHFLNGWLRSVAFWPTRLSNLKMQELVN